jgi:hypothetical protein
MPDCRRLCTCQNGNYGCVNLCQSEDRRPSVPHCPNARLLPVRGQCCREWACEAEQVQRDPASDNKRPRHTKLPSHNLIMSAALKYEYVSYVDIENNKVSNGFVYILDIIIFVSNRRSLPCCFFSGELNLAQRQTYMTLHGCN